MQWPERAKFKRRDLSASPDRALAFIAASGRYQHSKIFQGESKKFIRSVKYCARKYITYIFSGHPSSVQAAKNTFVIECVSRPARAYFSS